MSKRSLLALLLVAVLLLSTAVPSLAQQGEGVVIEELGVDYLAYPETSGTVVFSNCWGGSRVPLIEAWIEQFNSFYPDITIINDTLDCGSILQTQVTQIGGGSPPDAMMVNSNNFPFFQENGDRLLALNEWAERDNVDLDSFYPGEIGARILDGTVYGLPNVTAGAQHMLYVNTRLLEEVGWGADTPVETWQDLMALTELASEQDLFVMDPAKMPGNQTIFQALLYANGGALWNDELTEIQFNSEAGVEAAQYLIDLINAQADSYEDLAIAGNRRDVVTAVGWSPEEYIATPNGSWMIFQLSADAPHIEYAIYDFPRNADSEDSMGYTFVEGGWSFSIAKDSGNTEAAWEWIKFITLTDFTCEFVAAQVRPSPLRSCNEDPRLQESTPYWGVIENSLATARPVPVTDIHTEFQEIMFQMEDEIIFGTMSPEEALAEYAAQAQELLDEWNADR